MSEKIKMNRKNPNTTLVFCPLRVIPVIVITIAIVIIIAIVIAIIIVNADIIIIKIATAIPMVLGNSLVDILKHKIGGWAQILDSKRSSQFSLNLEKSKSAISL